MTEKPARYNVDSIESRIFTIRGQKVILDADLAHVYGVSTRRLNEQIRRNKGRFPPDFAFRLNPREYGILKSQIATSIAAGNRSQFATGSQKHRDPHFLPIVFTEHGAIMAANVLNSPQAVRMGVFVVRAFVKLRETLAVHRELARKLDDLISKVDTHDIQFEAVFDAIRKLMKEPERPRRPIGFTAKEGKAGYRA